MMMPLELGKESAMSEVIYTCAVCGKERKAKTGKPIPLCCKKEMAPLPFCTSAPNPEMSRNYDEDMPCDDGTQAKPKAAPKKKK
jgi:hypothetical protein